MTETAPRRLGAIRTALRELVDEHGSELLSNPARMSNLIKDLLPDDQQLARILVVAAEQDVASKLAEYVSQGMDAATAIRLVATSFAASTMFAEQACLWVVSELAIAMGLASGESTTPVAGDGGVTPVWAAGGEVAVPDEGSGPASARLAGASQVDDPSPALPRRSRRRGLVLALSATTVVVVAAAVILGLKIGSSPPASRSPASSHAPARGNFVVDRQLSDDGSLVLTLTTIKLRGNLMTAYVAYHNSTGLPQILSCVDDTDPSASSITLANGRVIHSAATYCSEHPSATIALNASGTHSSYAVFHVPAGFPEPFSFYWTTGNGSSSVSNIRI
ncbi:MAG TPA: hypothetical protein VFI65_22990 [Streptosporangiaceae bacterium]|nr:hypothetical protein [Streptosporangiaceae bacterium]